MPDSSAPIRVRVVAAPVVRAGLAALLAGRNGRDGRDARLAVLGDAEPGGAAAPADVVVWAPPWHELDAAPARLARDGAPADGADLLPLGTDGGRGPGLVVVADAPGAAWTAAMLRAGVRAVVPSSASPEELQTAVEAAAAGFVAVPAELASELLALLPAPAAVGDEVGTVTAASAAVPPEAALLTPRERDVLALLAEGLANKQIAPRLGISEHTVKAHVAAIFAKLGAGTRAEAVVTAARRGLLML